MFPVIMYVLLLKKTIRKNQLNVQQGIKILNVPYLVYSSRAGLANVETPAVSELTISYRKCYSYYCSSSQLGALLKTVITIKFCPCLDDILGQINSTRLAFVYASQWKGGHENAPETIFFDPGKAIDICQNFLISAFVRVNKMGSEQVFHWFIKPYLSSQ